ncbi:MAG TPA: hypothetical protein VKF81_03130, partial [Blastocatellia bacterium]|nr:hypothetical protein [Blastocatellia bacterium]
RATGRLISLSLSPRIPVQQPTDGDAIQGRTLHVASPGGGYRGVPVSRLHHSFATHAGADPSVPATALADVLGHKDWRTRMRYAHATEDGKR